jgi:hypothetical protein
MDCEKNLTERMTSSMYNSIQHFNEFGVKKIEERIKKFISEGQDLADLVLGLGEDVFELIRNIIVEVLEDMDEYLRNSAFRKKKWEIVRRDEASLLTSYGTIKYRKTYFKPKSGGKRRYLLDDIVGIEPHDKMSADVVINVVDEAIDSTYRKGGQRASCLDEITKQSVMNKIHELEVIEPELKVEKKKEVRFLYIEADEDHVALQHRSDRKCPQKRMAMPKLVYVHEGIDYERSGKTRTRLKNIRYFGGIYKESEDLWLEVANYIDSKYNLDAIETIYLSGDGASWIQTGLQWIPKSRFVLDNYHLKKYMITATSHLNDKGVYQELDSALLKADKSQVKNVFRKILKLTDSDTKTEAVKAAGRYILKNWEGIKIKAEPGNNIVGCSAEGHVSHVFSSRLSSRPKGWSEKGAAKMSRLIIYKKNGGKVYDLVMAQKRKHEIERREMQDQLVKEMRKLSESKYANSWNSKPTVITTGKKTALYNELRSIAGIRY